MDENKPQSSAPEQEAAPEPAPTAEMPESSGAKFDMNEAPEMRGMPESPDISKAMRINLTGAIGKAKDTIVGSTHLLPEVDRVMKGYGDLAVNTVKTPLTALGSLVSLPPHVLGAARNFKEGAIQTMGNMVDIVSSPLRGGVAGIYEAGRGIKSVAGLPVKIVKGVLGSPFKAFDILDKGAGRLDQFLKRVTA